MLISSIIKTLVVVIFVPIDLLLLVSIYRVKTLHYNPVYILSRSLVVLDIGALLVIISYDIPSTIMEKGIYGW